MSSNYKPIGGVESCTLYPADAVQTIIFSSKGCSVQLQGSPIEVELLDDSSHYHEEIKCKDGLLKVLHRLQLVADRKAAEKWLDTEFLEQLSIEGAIAVVKLEDGRSLLVGYSSHFGDEQPLRLEYLISESGNNLHDKPIVTIQLLSYDTEFSSEIL